MAHFRHRSIKGLFLNGRVWVFRKMPRAGSTPGFIAVFIAPSYQSELSPTRHLLPAGI